MHRTIHSEHDRSATVAIGLSPLTDGTAHALVFLIDPALHGQLEAMAAGAFELTSAESAVSTSFL